MKKGIFEQLLLGAWLVWTIMSVLAWMAGASMFVLWPLAVLAIWLFRRPPQMG